MDDRFQGSIGERQNLHNLAVKKLLLTNGNRVFKSRAEDREKAEA